jgi:hypothetical protein
MPFKPGQCGNPKGRPKGSGHGRALALAELDAMLSIKKNRRLLVATMQEKFREDPYGFFRRIIMPLLPKESKVAMSSDGIVEWKSLVEAFPEVKGPLPAPPAKP